MPHNVCSCLKCSRTGDGQDPKFTSKVRQMFSVLGGLSILQPNAIFASRSYASHSMRSRHDVLCLRKCAGDITMQCQACQAKLNPETATAANVDSCPFAIVAQSV